MSPSDDGPGAASTPKPTAGSTVTPTPESRGEWWLARAALVTPLGASLTAQLIWGFQTGSAVLIGWGCLATVIFGLSIHRWRRLPPGPVRNLSMTGVVLVVGGWTWLHTAKLLISQLPPEPNALVRYIEVGLCIGAFLPIEGLAVLSVLSLDQTTPSVAVPRPVGRIRRVWRRLRAWLASWSARSTPSSTPESMPESTPSWGPPDSVQTPVHEPHRADPDPGQDREDAARAKVHAFVAPGLPPGSVPRSRTRPSSRNVHGWSESMAAVPREVHEAAKDWVRRRASAVGLPQSTPAAEVQRAEVTRATRPQSTTSSRSIRDDHEPEGASA